MIAPDASVSAKALWDDFYFWATDNGEQADRKMFAARLSARGYQKRKVGHARVWTWLGIGLRHMAKTAQNPVEPLAQSGANGSSIRAEPKLPS